MDKCQSIDNGIKDGFDIFRRFENPEIKNEIDLWIDEIVLGLVTVCHIFNPPAIVMGGGIMSETYITSEVQKRLTLAVMPGYRDVLVLPALLKNKAGLMGSAYNAIRKIKNAF